MYVIGTAGHVDHGKSALVMALTGIDPDRLREEKERGLTIDLGFAWLDLPSGRSVSIVDVPGHERFIKNMLAGAGGVDLALLVVAADEGPMPQTREHLAILELLDVPGGVVAITKCDLVEDEYVELVEAELDDLLAGTCLEGARRVRTSAATGAGLDELRTAIDVALDGTPAKRDLGRPRLPIDRAFTIRGFGAVVTGTLLDGALHVGQEVAIEPGGLKARIRGLQRHKTKVDRLEPGTRAAVNLSGIHAEDLRRGMVLAAPGVLTPVRAVDVRLRSTGLVEHPLAHDAGVTFLCATAESEARLRLLDCDRLAPGKEAWAQLVLETPVAVVPGDHCVVRTSNDTVAGGPIVAINPRRHRRNHQPTIDALARLLEGSPADRLRDLLAERPRPRASLPGILGVRPEQLDETVVALAGSGDAIDRDGTLYGRSWLDAAAARVVHAVQAYVAANPLRAGAPREHAREQAGLEPQDFAAVVDEAVRRGTLAEREGRALAPPGHEPRPSPEQQAQIDRFLAGLREGGYSPPTDGLPPPDLLAYLADRGLIEDTGAGVVFDRAAYDDMVARIAEYIRANGGISLAEVRDLFGTSRKYAQALLEHMDDTRITRRVGDVRVLRAPAEARQ
ncbi:MAG: selenocysteine-specific translation elongation factor [Dehalococcoidia bacterium]